MGARQSMYHDPKQEVRKLDYFLTVEGKSEKIC